jgi:ankyrin repeat protein
VPTPTRVLPPRPHFTQLKRQAKELLEAVRAGDAAAIAEARTHFRGAEPAAFALHEAQLVLARAYGFDSWPRLKAFVEGGSGARALIKPVELETANGRDTWDTIVAASAGDVDTLRGLLARDRRLARAGYWYAPAVHFAVREGHADAVRLLLDEGADPEGNGLNDRNLIEMARERGYEAIAQMLEQERERRGRVTAHPADHPIHRAAALGEIDVVRAFLDADPSLGHRGSRRGLTPLQCAAIGGRAQMALLLLDRGASIHARNPNDLEAIDFAIWGERYNDETVRLLLSRGATYDLTIASALGDLAGVRQMLDRDPSRISETRPNGRRPLTVAVELGHDEIARLLLERGADPRWEPAEAVHAAARLGNLAILKLLLEHGADANEDIDSTSLPITFAATPEIRALLEAHGGGLGIYDTTWIEHDDELLKRIAADPSDPHRIGAAFAMSADRPELLARLLGAGLRMPSVHTSCQGYLVNATALKMLLAHGMSPDQMNWQHQTLLHHASTRETTECAAILLDAGASITARDDDYRSTPLAWAARVGRPVMVEFLLSRGAPVTLPDDEPWATPLAWAERRGHQEVVSILRAHGAA